MSIEKTASLIGVGVVMILLGIAIFSREDRGGEKRPNVRSTADERGDKGRTLDLTSDLKGPKKWKIGSDGSLVPAPEPELEPKGPRNGGSSANPADDEARPTGPRRTIKIRQGDSYWRVAKRELGDARLHPLVQDVNPDLKSFRAGLDLILPSGEEVARFLGGLKPGDKGGKDKAAKGDDTRLASLRTHKVARNENLSVIARRYYSKAESWPRILDANRKILKSPRDLREGMVLVIP